IQKEKSLEEVQQQNETAQCRMIGVTIETRPDYVSAEEISRLRWLGVTRVELGVQSLEEAVLHRIVRDHTTAEIRTATRLLKDAGFKVAYHLMPNLPGATPQSDLESARMLFSDPAYRPDALKLYPCVVIESAELYGWWKSGHYVPYDDETLIELLMDIKQLVPPYVRIERVIRDIPSPSILAGCVLTNLREEVIRRMRLRGLTCQCIRCRQVRQGHAGPFELNRRDYDASGGREIFLSFENKAHDLAALLRLRLPSAGQRQELSGSLHGISEAALVRELHTYGPHVPLSHHRKDAVQHQGFGQRLLEEAQRIARQQAFQRLAVISGVGAREYYRRFGFTLEQTYMIKPL
ncbi:MAG: tRNA uridine(34) 5-carboxymethylaminomethyl modification radical SAM/GNAT enzyme Elp3, partial [Candidatus Omnitrophica bacterium]|nr:tRNA uridine(34) 5-carboxymethylaminomethyl modification radical SAM/GNAT enzyme Elp3 [Candidatus Omnitrophota bacterium]